MRRTEVRPISRRREISDLLIPWRNSLRASAAFVAAVEGRPRRFPLCRAWSKPARTRSRSMSCSNWANTDSMPAIALPVDVVRSRASVSDTKPTLMSLSSCSVVTRSINERPQRSSRHTRTTSISRRRAASISCWRCSRATAPEPTSLTCMATVHPRFAAYSRRARILHRKSLLIKRGDTCIEPRPQHFRRFACLAKNPLRFCLAGSAFGGHFQVVLSCGRRR
jgi:hypothetical protein